MSSKHKTDAPDIRLNIRVSPLLRQRYYAAMRVRFVTDRGAPSHMIREFMRTEAEDIEARYPDEFKKQLQQIMEEELSAARATAQTIDDLPQNHDDSATLKPIGKQTQG